MQNRRYYIYAHKDGADIVYVGKGCAGRLYDTKRSDPDHEQFTLQRQSEGDYDYAEMIEVGLTERQALKLETSMIKQLQPKYNTAHLGKSTSYERVYPDLPPEEAMALGSAKGVEAARLSTRTGKRGPGKKNPK